MCASSRAQSGVAVVNDGTNYEFRPAGELVHVLRITPIVILVSVAFGLSTAAAQNKPAPNKKAPNKKAPPKKDDAKKPDKDAKKPDKADDKKKPNKPSAEDIEKAKAAFLKGRELFDAKKFDLAIKEFKTSFRLSRNALLLYNIAFTLDNLKQKQKALFYYKKFLSDAPEGAANRDHATERAKKLARELDADAIFAPKPKTTKVTKTDPKPTRTRKPGVSKFMHNVVEEAPPGYPLDITAFVPEGAKWQVNLKYRAANEAKFTTVMMKERYSELVGRIPAAKMSGRSVQYYIEVRDRGGKIIARSGRSNSPHLVYIDKSAKPRYYPDLTNDPSRVIRPVLDPDKNKSEVPKGDGGWTDTTSGKFKYAKWGSTISAASFITLGISFYFLAAQRQASLEGEAFASTTTDQCPFPRPCRSYSDIQKALEDDGKMFNTLTNVSLAIGIVSAGVAGYFWWKELKAKKERKAKPRVRNRSLLDRVVAIPVIGKDVVGGGAALRF